IETPEDRRWVQFKLRGQAKFSDGKQVTPEDVIFSQELLRDQGRPNHRFYYSKVERAEIIGADSVRFTFVDDGDREMPLIMGLMPILPKHIFTNQKFDQTSLEPPVGSGPYIVTNVDPGTSLTYERNKKYWGMDLAVNKGRYNFDEIRYTYFRDANTVFEAFKKGLIDLRTESDPGKWAEAYNFPAVTEKKVQRAEVKLQTPAGMAGLVFNTRRPQFADIRVRRALTQMFDFEWVNKTFYHGLYSRSHSYFERSELSSFAKPVDAIEEKILKPYFNNIDPKIWQGNYRLPVTDGSGRNRVNRRNALRLLKQAGYVLKNGILVDGRNNRPFKFELLIANRGQERLLLSFARNLKTIGIDARLRQVDSAQYQQRKTTFDYDMIQNSWGASLSPGNEQNFRWSQKSATSEGSFNYPGVRDIIVDKSIEALLAARSRPEFVSSVRALDRVLRSGFYVIPLFHLSKQWVAYWRHLRQPATHSIYGFRIDSWWSTKK
ncbi:MAG: extracellular solute-binding protein, partial [Methyloligellaceae bacterium]